MNGEQQTLKLNCLSLTIYMLYGAIRYRVNCKLQLRLQHSEYRIRIMSLNYTLHTVLTALRIYTIAHDRPNP